MNNIKIFDPNSERYYTIDEIRDLYVDEYLAGALDQIDVENDPNWDSDFSDSDALTWFESSYGEYVVIREK